jgi:hypothetical protein
MKRFISISAVCVLVIITGCVAVGCANTRHGTSSSRHLTEAQVLAIAKPMLPLPPGESYHVGFEDGTTWVVWTESATPSWGGRTVVTIRDIDGHAQLENRL